MLGTNGDVGLMLVIGVIVSSIGLIMLVLIVPRGRGKSACFGIPNSTEAFQSYKHATAVKSAL
ncbi:hypothetical protein GCM10025859_17380 [Alicyclobacillus fastidiosus]|nr:hypothetical protein GCM10025859_17380 [Alicyclobacillus fastidiosus]